MAVSAPMTTPAETRLTLPETEAPEVPAAPGTDPVTSNPAPAVAREIGGREGPEPTRFGDWEKAGRCIDF
jgi:hypothetical protein